MTICRRMVGAALFSLATFVILERPALADVPIFQGIYGSSPAIFAGIWTMGVAFVAVVLIEAAVYRRVFKMQWRGVLIASLALNAFSSGAGYLLGAFAFELEIFIVAVIVAVIVVRIALRKKGMPSWYPAIAYISVVVGLAGSVLTSFPTPPDPPGVVLLLFLAPLPLGFGLTLLLEAYLAEHFFGIEKYWRGLLLANVASYIFLVLVIPFFGPNPYAPHYVSQVRDPKRGDWQIFMVGQGMIESGESADEVMKYFETVRASNLYLLGLTRQNPPPRNYDARNEIAALVHACDSVSRNPQAETGMTIIDRLLQYPSLQPEAADKLEWLKQYLAYWLQARKAIEEHSQEDLDKVYEEWFAWRDKTIFQTGILQILGYAGFFPSNPIESELSACDSSLHNPGAKEEEE